MKKYFIDTNIIIDLLKKKPEAIEVISSIASDKESKIFINQLVNLESLRTIPFQNSNIFKKAKVVLEGFEKVEINHEIYERTIEFSRYFKTVKHQSLKGKCEAIDLLHFITAKHYNLELITYDKDFERLEVVYQEFTDEVRKVNENTI
jgi:predicted nucleic acid-binding protein